MHQLGSRDVSHQTSPLCERGEPSAEIAERHVNPVDMATPKDTWASKVLLSLRLCAQPGFSEASRKTRVC